MIPTRRNAVKAAATLSRRDMSTSSGSGPLAKPAPAGSSAIPQIGQDPGPICRTSGCIGQVFSTPAGSTLGARYLRIEILFGVALKAGDTAFMRKIEYAPDRCWRQPPSPGLPPCGTPDRVHSWM